MAPLRSHLSEHTEALLNLIKAGKLFTIQEWLRSGKPVHPNPNERARINLLAEAVSTGFHSIVEVLAKAPGWDAGEMSAALELARERRRFDIAEVLVSAGAKDKERDFATVLEEMDIPAIERFLLSGTDPNQNNAFADALRQRNPAVPADLLRVAVAPSESRSASPAQPPAAAPVLTPHHEPADTSNLPPALEPAALCTALPVRCKSTRATEPIG